MPLCDRITCTRLAARGVAGIAILTAEQEVPIYLSEPLWVCPTHEDDAALDELVGDVMVHAPQVAPDDPIMGWWPLYTDGSIGRLRNARPAAAA